MFYKSLIVILFSMNSYASGLNSAACFDDRGVNNLGCELLRACAANNSALLCANFVEGLGLSVDGRSVDPSMVSRAIKRYSSNEKQPVSSDLSSVELLSTSGCLPGNYREFSGVECVLVKAFANSHNRGRDVWLIPVFELHLKNNKNASYQDDIKDLFVKSLEAYYKKANRPTVEY